MLAAAQVTFVLCPRLGKSCVFQHLCGHRAFPCYEQRISPRPVRERQVRKDNLRTLVTQYPERFCAAGGVDGLDVLFLESRRQLTQRLLSVMQHEDRLSKVHVILPALGLAHCGLLLNATERSARHEQARGL